MQQGHHQRTCCDLECFAGCIAAAKYAFAALTVVINFADVTTDIVVAVQFHEDGETTWFWLVVADLILAHIIYTVIGTLIVLPSHPVIRWQNVPVVFRLFVSLIIAQFMPTVLLIADLLYNRGHRDTDDDFQAVQRSAFRFRGSVDDGRGPTAAVQEEAASLHRAHYLQRSVTGDVKDHLKRYGLFYVESAIEAAPQAIIQLLAITFLGRASPAQLVSLCCSLFSITSKAFVISQAYDARVMAFKFALAAHDVFSTFYLFSTLVAQETTKDTDFFGLEVSWLGYMWLWKIVVYAGYMAVCGLCMYGYAVNRIFRRANRCFEAVGNSLGLFCCGVLAYLPTLLLSEAGRLVYGTLLLRIHEPSPSMWPTMTLWSTFVKDDDSDGSRVRFFAEMLVTTPSQSLYWDRPMMPTDADSIAIMDELHGVIADPAPPTLWSLERAFRGLGGPPFRLCKGQPFRERVWRTWLLTTACLLVIGQCFSFAYPFVHASEHFDGHNILQATCFYALCVTLLICLVLLPFAYSYVVFNMTTQFMRTWWSSSRDWFTSLNHAYVVLEKFHMPSHVGALVTAVRVDVLPADVTEMCAEFLSARDLGLHDLSINECRRLRRVTASRRHQQAKPREITPCRVPAFVPFGEEQSEA